MDDYKEVSRDVPPALRLGREQSHRGHRETMSMPTQWPEPVIVVIAETPQALPRLPEFEARLMTERTRERQIVEEAHQEADLKGMFTKERSKLAFGGESDSINSFLDVTEVYDGETKIIDVGADLNTHQSICEDIPLINPGDELLDLPGYPVTDGEDTSKLLVSVKEVGQVLQILMDHIEGLEPEQDGNVYEILDEIILKIRSAKDTTEVNGISREVNEVNPESSEAIEEELKELFIQLFECLGIEQRPKLLDLLINLATEADVSLLLRTDTASDLNIDLPDGTHEVIKQLLASLTAVPHKMAQAYEVGKATLSIYCAQLSNA
jgi:hypothetical protein